MLAPGEYTVSFHSCFEDRPSAWRLLELEPEMEEVVTSGGSLYVKGDMAAPAVLCTDEKTWNVKMLEDSNLILFGSVSDGGGGAVDLRGSCGAFMQCSAARPQLKSVRTLLQADAYGDIDLEDRAPAAQRLEFESPASPAELKAFLEREAVYVGERYRGLAPDFSTKTCESVLAALAAEGLAEEEFDLDTCCRCLAERFGTQEGEADGAALGGHGSQPRAVIAFVLLRLATSSREGDAPEKYRLDADKILRFRTQKVLLDALDEDPDTLLTVAELLERVRADVEVDEARLLKSVADCSYVLDGEVAYLDNHELPDTPAERLGDLFERKPQWLAEELRPFLEPLLASGSLEEFLAKHARALYRGPRDNEEQFFVRRAAGLGLAPL